MLLSDGVISCVRRFSHFSQSAGKYLFKCKLQRKK